MSKKFIVEISARHCHLSAQDLSVLFGADASLTNKKDLSQPGQFASDQVVTLEGPKKSLNFRVLGPVRSASQFELSLTEAHAMGITVPIRESGHIQGSAGGKIIGPKGEVEITQGIIAAQRHIHVDLESAKEMNVANNQVVSVKVQTPDRSLIFENTVVRVDQNYALAMHIDTDESNAAGLSGQGEGEIVVC